MDSFLLNRKGLLGKLAKNIMAHQTIAEGVPLRNDLVFIRYEGKVIRNIQVRRLDFGTPITDTSSHFKNKLTQLAKDFHRTTREQVIRNNLFLKKGDKLVSHILADNERHLRDLPYLLDAKIAVMYATADSVDILVLTKDVLSIGGSYQMHNTQKMSVGISEDNLGGWGHELLLRTLFDNIRNPKFGYGAKYTARNIKGSFIDADMGYLSYNNNFNTWKENEELMYTGFVRPLVNPYMKFTYAAEAAWHNTANVYSTDSLYETAQKYRYYNYDAWIGWNAGAFKIFGNNKDNRLRTLIGLRYLQRNFSEVPIQFLHQYNYQYADLRAVLSSITIFRQDFYKTQYIYGFGRNEDIPEGADISFTAGWTRKSGVERPYFGLDIQRYFFTRNESYFNCTLKADGYWRQRQSEDVNILFNVDYFSRLMHLGTTWKERNFISADIAHQSRLILNEPLFLQSDFGLREWRNDTVTLGNTRATLKIESVFFTPWNLANFRFAPFAFANVCMFTPMEQKISRSNWYNSYGGGLRTRNESLIFETLEFKAFFFPNKNFFGDYWRLEFNTNVRFKFNRQFIKKPDFVNANGL